MITNKREYAEEWVRIVNETYEIHITALEIIESQYQGDTRDFLIQKENEQFDKYFEDAVDLLFKRGFFQEEVDIIIQQIGA